MISLEQEIKNYFAHHQIQFSDHSESYKHLDFSFGDKSTRRFFNFDAKEKCEPYRTRNWPRTGIPEEYFFILDDLAARKILAFAPNSGLVIRDNVKQRYFLFSIVQLFLMPKIRVNRKINRQVKARKGKWLIDLRNGTHCKNLEQIFQQIEFYLDERENIFMKTLECYGDFIGEKIQKGGITRTPNYWPLDYKRTR